MVKIKAVAIAAAFINPNKNMMKNRIPLSLIFIVFLANTQVFAQTNLNGLIKAQEEIDKSTRQEIRVEKKDIYSNVESSDITDSVFPDEQYCFEINEVIIENNFLNNDPSIKRLQQNAEGRCLGILGIERLATDLQDYIINAGYVTSRVEIPEQDLSAHVLTLRVAVGRIEDILIKDNDVKDWILPYKKEDVLYIRDLEQGLEALQKTPGVDVKTHIEPGEQHNYSRIVIDTGRKTNWNGRIWFNNWGSEGTGKKLIGTAGYLYNQIKMNDVFFISGSTNTELDGGYKNLTAYYSVPFGYWDYELFYSHSESKQPMGIRELDLTYYGKNQSLGFKGYRTIYRDQDKKITATTELIKRKVNYRLNDLQLVLQKRNMLNVRLGLNYKQNFDGALFESTLSYQRFLPWFGAEKTPDMKSGDVSSISHVFNLEMSYIKLFNLLSLDSYYDIKVGVQYSPDKLTLQDQFTIGNRWSVRGFEFSSGLDGDKGFYVQNNFTLKTGIQNIDWYAGLDYGQLWGDLSAGDLYDNKRLMGTVTGLKGQIASLGYDLSLSKPLLYPNAMVVDKWNTNFNIYYKF